MGQLLFRKVFWEAIARGSKRTTVRRWNRARLKAGQRAFAPGVGWLDIETVDAVDLASFTDADARADGFESLKEMFAALHEMYPDKARDGKQWFRIAFRLASEQESARKKI